MEKGKVLALGCGGCGCNQLDILMGLDVRYSGMFINTNLAEMEDLEHFDIERRCFYIANADGTGKDRSVAETYFKEEAPKFTEKIKRFVNQPYVLMLTSANGGTGSKAVILLSRLIKNVCPEKSINIVATFPSVNESDIDYENALDFWEELMQLKKRKIIDSIQFIDNNKSQNEEEINIRAMKELDESFSFASGKLDNSDLQRVHVLNGYKVFLKLKSDTKDLKEAINEAIKSSVFYVPEKNLDCDGIVGNINYNLFSPEDVQKEIEFYGFNKFNDNKGEIQNVLLIGGCETPRETIDLVNEALKESERKRKRRVIEDEVVIRRHSKKDNNEVETKNNTPKSARLSSKDLNDLFNDDSFWND